MQEPLTLVTTALAVPLFMFVFNGLVRSLVRAQQSPATDLIFVFLVFDFSVTADPAFATKIIDAPVAGTSAMVWMVVLTLASLTVWLALLLRLEKPVFDYYAGREQYWSSYGAEGFPFFAWTTGWALAAVAIYFHAYLLRLNIFH